MYGIASPGGICIDDEGTAGAGDQATCQAVRAPESPGERLVTEERAEALMTSARSARPGDDTEIRLTYRQLTALIEEAVRSLQ